MRFKKSCPTIQKKDWESQNKKCLTIPKKKPYKRPADLYSFVKLIVWQLFEIFDMIQENMSDVHQAHFMVLSNSFFWGINRQLFGDLTLVSWS